MEDICSSARVAVHAFKRIYSLPLVSQPEGASLVFLRLLFTMFLNPLRAGVTKLPRTAGGGVSPPPSPTVRGRQLRSLFAQAMLRSPEVIKSQI